MNFLLSVFFGAGVAAWTYSKFGRRMGYANTGNQAKVALVVFVIASLFFYTILATIIS